MRQALQDLGRTGAEGLLLSGAGGFDAWEAFRSMHRLVEAAGGAVQDEQGRLLVIHRRGHWDLPKGKLDPGEDHAAAAIREVQEECGLQRLALLEELPETWHTYAEKGAPCLKRTRWFRMQGSAAEPLRAQHEEDIELAKWAAREELPALIEASYPSLRAVFSAWLAGSEGPAAPPSRP